MSLASKYYSRKRMADGGDVEKEEKKKQYNAQDKSDWSHPKFGEGYSKDRDVKGVHTSAYSSTSGKSEAGLDNLASQRKDHGIRREYSPEQRGADAKRKHMQVLSEMKKMPRPRGEFADGGEVSDDPLPDPKAERGRKISNGFMSVMAHGGECPACGYADGGFVHEEEASGYPELPIEDEEGYGMVDEIMKQRYSEGGVLANEDHGSADEEPNQFDDLVKDDHLEANYKDNDGEVGDVSEDEDRSDMISEIMRSRKKKGQMPSPA